MATNQAGMKNHLLSIALQPHKYPDRHHYPFSLPIFSEPVQLQFETPVTFFVGENGTGKSTLLEAIALACNVHIWRRDESTRFQANPNEKKLFRYLSVEWRNGMVPGSYFGSEIFNDFRRIVDNWAASDPGQLKYFGGKSLVTQSHGQSMMSFFESRYRIRGIYFLDEPETALSPNSQMKLLELIRENTDQGHAQFILATHSPILLTYAGARIFSFDDEQIREVQYKDTDHYKLYKRILSGR